MIELYFFGVMGAGASPCWIVMHQYLCCYPHKHQIHHYGHSYIGKLHKSPFSFHSVLSNTYTWYFWFLVTYTRSFYSNDWCLSLLFTCLRVTLFFNFIHLVNLYKTLMMNFNIVFSFQQFMVYKLNTLSVGFQLSYNLSTTITRSLCKALILWQCHINAYTYLAIQFNSTCFTLFYH